MSQQTPNNCSEPGNIQSLNSEPTPQACRDGFVEFTSGTIPVAPYQQNLNETNPIDLDWLEKNKPNNKGIGKSGLCDPQQQGHITNGQKTGVADRNVVHKYSQSIRGTDEGMKDLFSDIMVSDSNGKLHKVPIFWGTQERAIAFMVQDNVRKDNSTVIERVRLPMMSIYQTGISPNNKLYCYHQAIDYLRDYKNGWKPSFVTHERYEKDTIFGVSRGIPVSIRYNLVVWTMYEEDLSQILEQIMLKFSPMAYIRVSGISMEIGVFLEGINNSINYEPGDKANRVIKYEFDLVAESFIAQPIVRKKSVLATRIDMGDSLIDEETRDILTRIEETVKEM